MTDYAVINPATGEHVKEFPTITDDELAAAIKLAHETHQRWARTTSVEDRAALVRRVGELHPSGARSWPPSPSARWASPPSRRWARSISAPTSMVTMQTTVPT